MFGAFVIQGAAVLTPRVKLSPGPISIPPKFELVGVMKNGCEVFIFMIETHPETVAFDVGISRERFH